ncbi:hypothetical protein HanIR_Chr12g0590951 [Helianthus annuus]|nr:hypothetical protein HanIR_Chr12g0590951 [Helianthus annuus]
MHGKVYKSYKIFVLGPYSPRLTVRKEVTGRCAPGSVKDRKRLDLRSVSNGYGPQEITLTVRKLVAGQKNWTDVS